MAGQIYANLKTTFSSSLGETPIGATSIVACDSVASLDLLVVGGTVQQKAALAVTKSLVQGFYLSSSQPITLYFNGTNEVQTITISATGGTFTITYSGQTTSAIAYNATAATVQAALEALSNIAVGDVSVTGSAGGPYSIEFIGTLGLQNVAAVTTNAGSLTGGAGTAVVATPTPGVAPDATWTFAADDPHQWRTGGLFTNPMPGNLVNVFITNAGTVAARVRLRFAVNAA